MTHHESFPGRPRGRRARPDNDVPEWAGYDAVPQDKPEFPDLSATRGREAPARDGRVHGEARLPEGAGYPPNVPGYPPQGSGQASQGQPPWEDQPWRAPRQPAEPQPRPSLRPQPSLRPRPRPRQGPGHEGTDWTGAASQDPMEAFSERWRRRGGESREERRADRRRRRRLLIAAGAGAAVVIAVAVYFLIGGKSTPANPDLGSLITTFLPGEIRQVPDACTSVPGATLSEFLPGQPKTAAPPLNTGADSQCTWTLDKAPLYRVLEVNIQAYSPNALVSYGDGSATFAAINAYAQDETAKQSPAPRSGQPPSAVTDLSGMPGGSDTVAFEAAQVFKVNGAITDMATVVVRYRNVIVTVVLNGLDHANVGKYGPVSQAALNSAAQTIAREVTGEIVR